MSSGRGRKISVNLLIPFALIALVFGALIWKKVHDSREVRPVPDVNEPAAVRKVVLFFVADGDRLAREAREVESCTDTTECVRDLLDELFSGPVGDLDAAVPDTAAVNGVRVEGDMAVIDLNRSFAADLSPGSSAEMLAVYSIVDTVCVNFPQFTRVRLIIDGDEKPVLKHLDLSDPLVPDFSLERAAPAQGAGGAAPPSTPKVKKGNP
jgi:hypothetical protein